jgi:hypothetical protein
LSQQLVELVLVLLDKGVHLGSDSLVVGKDTLALLVESLAFL